MAAPKITKSISNKQDWQIFCNNENPLLAAIADRKTLIPTVSTTRYVPLAIPLRSKLKRFYNYRFKSSKFTHIIQIMRKIYENAKKSCSAHHVEGNILRRIHQIIPNEFFGTNYHRKLFNKTLKKLVTRTAHECILIRSVVRNFKFENIPWLKHFDHTKQEKYISYLYYPLEWVLQVAKYVLRRHYYFITSSYPHEIQLVPYNVWKRFHSKVLNRVILKKYAVPVNVSLNQVKGVVHFIPKDDLNKLKFRPILKLYKKGLKNSSSIKYYNRIICDYAKTLSPVETSNFYNFWKSCVQKFNGKQHFCAKVDVSDAYGRVQIDTLGDIINKMAVSFKTKQYLTNHITAQYVTFRNPNNPKTKTYRWTHGLLQGDPLSPALCKLYLAYLDSVHLSEFDSNSNNLIHRTVDDYIFVSLDQQEVKIFIKVMNRTHILKHHKIMSNVQLPGCLKTEKIHYCGLTIDGNTKEIIPHFNIRPNTSLHGKFKLWNMNNPVTHQNFIIKAMRYQYNNYYFGQTFLNLNYNTEETALNNYFEAMVYLAFKYDIAVSAIYNWKEVKAYGEVLGEVVYEYAKKALSTIRTRNCNITCKAQNKNCITFAMLIKIGYFAFHLVLRKKSIYNPIVKEIKDVNNKIFIKAPFNVKSYKRLPECFSKVRVTRKVSIISI